MKSLFYILFFILLSFEGFSQINFAQLSGRNGNLPVLATTTAATSITTTTASSGGNVTSDGGASIIARGVVWSTSPNPVISLSTKTTYGSGIGSFTSSITGLTINTTYYVRAYATNSIGTGYGTQISFSTYTYVTICKQQWMEKNLDVTTYRDGTVIPQVTDATAWAGLTTGAWCYYNNDPANGAIYGKMYNWYAVTGIATAESATPTLQQIAARKQLAPPGWHIPTKAEWTTLSTSLGGDVVAGEKMKLDVDTYWGYPQTASTNSSGFSALPGGIRDKSGSWRSVRDAGSWWSATQDGGTDAAWFRTLNSSNGNLTPTLNYSQQGLSVRCVRDTVKIGDPYAGGIVAYILVNGDPGYDACMQHGLIAATSDQSTGIWWYNGSYTTTGATGTAIGTGLSNTNTIITSQGGTATSYAAGLARAFTGGGYTDWYLPSQDELYKLYLNRTAIGGFAIDYYWSSTEVAYNIAYFQSFVYGSKLGNGKHGAFYVRAIRAF